MKLKLIGIACFTLLAMNATVGRADTVPSVMPEANQEVSTDAADSADTAMNTNRADMNASEDPIPTKYAEAITPQQSLEIMAANDSNGSYIIDTGGNLRLSNEDVTSDIFSPSSGAGSSKSGSVKKNSPFSNPDMERRRSSGSDSVQVPPH